VRETLFFASLLRIKEEMPVEERQKRVEDVLNMLGLEGVGDVIVGDSLRKGISGGQARRLTIGVEIINLPDLIFLDEPTTGLDSNISYEVSARGGSSPQNTRGAVF
jgi:ABC-type multidrug transport system ATPase subunit